MSAKYFSDADGNYLGAFAGGAEPPAGAIERDGPPASAGAMWQGDAWVDPAPTGENVNQERERRILAGKSFTLSGHADPVAVSGYDTTQTNLLALAIAAQARIASGDDTTLTPYRDEENVVHQLTPPQVFDLWSQGAEYISKIYQASWAIKDDPAGIPENIVDDPRWP
jgi:hypothetical protein